MKKFATTIAALMPSLAFAQAPISNVNDVINKAFQIGNIVIYALVAIGVIFIVFNIVWTIIKGQDATEKKKALTNVGWGILGLAIIVSIWGLVGVLTRSFRTTPTNQPIPNVSNFTDGGGQPANQIPVIQ